MANGRDNQLARQIGEHLVAAELGRRGYVSTPFAGNVPMFDLLAADLTGRAFSIQVKAIRRGEWQLRADKLLDIVVGSDGTQEVRGRLALGNSDLICIFVVLADDRRDEFYVFRLSDLQDILAPTYKGRRRPKNPESMHCTVSPKQLTRFHENWELLTASRRERSFLLRLHRQRRSGVRRSRAGWRIAFEAGMRA